MHKTKATFLTRIRCVLVLLIITMVCTIFFMFQLAHSSHLQLLDSDPTTEDSHNRRNRPPQSALSAALQDARNKQYSIYQKQVSQKKDKDDKHDKERHLKEKKNQVQPQKKIGVGEGNKEEEEAMQQELDQQKKKNAGLRQQQQQVVESKKENQQPEKDHDKPPQQQPKQEKQKDSTNHQPKKHKPPQHRDDGDAAGAAAKNNHGGANKNVFADRQGILEEVEERLLSRPKELNLQKEMKQPQPSQEVPQIPQPKDHAQEIRELEAALALEESREEMPVQVTLHKGEASVVKIDVTQAEGAVGNTPEFRKEQLRLHELYKTAVMSLREEQVRQSADPLFVTPLHVPISKIPRVPWEPQVPYLGVLVDAGRHYFPISWWKHLIVHLYKLKFNLIHFRLTDDQTFNIQLESYPELANPVKLEYNNMNKTYTTQEIRELVTFAKDYNISFMPEINLPGHAGGFASIPGLVIMCAEFICRTGYGLPLNVEHPQIKTILKGILKEIIDIFGNPPFLHLGGDEVNMADPCFDEVHKIPFDYANFESDLKGILRELRYPEERVIRWERTGQSISLKRAGEL